MGRRLSETHRRAIIAYWRDRLAGARPLGGAINGADLWRCLRPDTKQPPTERQRFADAARALSATLAAEAVDPVSGKVDAWIAKYLTDRGRPLLITDAERAAVLARMRDEHRRARERTAPRLAVRVWMTEEVAAQLRAYAKASGAKSLGEAIGQLLREGKSGSRKPKRSAPPPVTGDLLALFEDPTTG